MNFDSFNLDLRIANRVKAAGYETPTPIQEKTIPVIMQGRDVLGLAQTGTGKTAAFALPILQKLLDGPRGTIRALILAPTRELAEQIYQNIDQLGKETGLTCAAVYGGVSMHFQLQKLRRGVDILVACPGRLLDHIRQRTLTLENVEVFVLDEADQMFDMGFLPTVRQLIKYLPKKRQTLLFSATMPDSIRSLARDILSGAETINVGQSAPVATVSHALYPVDQHLKTGLLIELLKHTNTDSVLVFARTKHRAKRVAQTLTRSGFEATSLQGNLSQNQRNAAMRGFRDGAFQVLVATDIAARGIDVSSISHVINYDIPDTVEAYTHRIGRTGRAAKTGDAFTLVTRQDGGLVKQIERTIGKAIERRRIEGFDYAAKGKGDEFAREAHERDGRDERRGGGFGGGRRSFGERQSGGRNSGGRGSFGGGRRNWDDAPRTESRGGDRMNTQPALEAEAATSDRQDARADSRASRFDNRDSRSRGSFPRENRGGDSRFGGRSQRSGFGRGSFGGRPQGDRQRSDAQRMEGATRNDDRSDSFNRNDSNRGEFNRGDRPERADRNSRSGSFRGRPSDERRESSGEGFRGAGAERPRSFGGRPERSSPFRGGRSQGGHPQGGRGRSQGGGFRGSRGNSRASGSGVER
jgi:ATP-dependent RNA helicase RhlE